jgi:hypothetical protein
LRRGPGDPSIRCAISACDVPPGPEVPGQR